MRREQIVTHAPAPLILFILAVLAAALVSSCATARYGRDSVRAGEELSETLLVVGTAFELERETSRGTVAFRGSISVSGEVWRFTVTAWRPADGAWRDLAAPQVVLYRGRLFDNGIAFYAALASPRWPLEAAFITAPCDFDILR
jgi:hypothetical protein